MVGMDGSLRNGILIRLLVEGDAGALAAAYRRNRAHLAPWEPARDESFFTEKHQAEIIRAKRAGYLSGSEVPWVLVMEDDGAGTVGTKAEGGRVVGAVTTTRHPGGYCSAQGSGKSALHRST